MKNFEKYGLNEMADILIERIEFDDYGNKIYLPFLFLDTLKMYSHSMTAENVKINGGNNHSNMISYSFNRNVNVKVQDALVSNNSYALLQGSKFTETFNSILEYVKKYLNVQDDSCLLTEKLYRKISFPYTKFSENDKMAIQIFSEYQMEKLLLQADYLDCIQKIIDNVNLSFKNDEGDIDYIGMAELFPQDLLKIESAKKLKKIEVINKCIAKKIFAIDTEINKKHYLLKNNPDYLEKNIVTYLNPDTMQPYNHNVKSWKDKQGYFKTFYKGEEYFKFERKIADEFTDYGGQITIDAKLSSGEYRLTGVTKKRNLNGKDEFYQICFPKVSLNFGQNFEINENSPVVFDFDFDVLESEDGNYMTINTFNGNINENGSFEVVENRDFFYNENKQGEVFTSKRVGLNIYVSLNEPKDKQIAEGSVWIKRNATHDMIYILDRIDTDEDYDNTIVVFTRDGLEEVNLYSGIGFTTLLSIRQIQYINGDLVQILPYWIYRGGQWFSNSNTLTQGVKVKIKNKTLVLENKDDFYINYLEGFSISNPTQEDENFSEELSLIVENIDEFSFANYSENLSIT